MVHTYIQMQTHTHTRTHKCRHAHTDKWPNAQSCPCLTCTHTHHASAGMRADAGAAGVLNLSQESVLTVTWSAATTETSGGLEQPVS